MKSALLAIATSMVIFAADYRHIDFDDKVDFTLFKTFSLRDGRINTNAREVFQRLRSSIDRRRYPQRPDVERPQGVAGTGGPDREF